MRRFIAFHFTPDIATETDPLNYSPSLKSDEQFDIDAELFANGCILFAALRNK
jgi:hypothetical protein